MEESYFKNLIQLKDSVISVLESFGVPSKYRSFDETGEKENIKIPTGANSEFFSNRAMGDWAEDKVSELLSQKFPVVHYGDSDEVSAEDRDFRRVYLEKIEDTRMYGKRPDLLLMSNSYLGKNDVSLNRTLDNDNIMQDALYGVEVLSSKFEAETYRLEKLKKMRDTVDNKVKEHTIYYISSPDDETKFSDYISRRKQLDKKEEALLKLQYTSKKAKEKIENLRKKTLKIERKKIKVSPERKKELEKKALLKYKSERIVSEVLKFTVKVEDLRIVYRWMLKYKKPQIFIQVFFDSMYAINVLKIFEIIAKGKDEWPAFMKIDSPAKSQEKATIVVPITEGIKIADNISMPTFEAHETKTTLGRHDAYVIPKNGKYVLNEENLKKVLEYNIE